MWRSSASTMRPAGRWRYTSGLEPGRPVGAAAGRCGPRAPARWGWWTFPAFGRPVRLMWHKWRWRCPAATCDVASFTEVDEQIAPSRSALTARAGRWATMAVGRDVRPVADVAAELGCDWHTANGAVLAWGEALLAADCDRVGAVRALGLDETLLGRQGRWRRRDWCTSIVDVQRGQLLDIVPGRDAEGPTRWLGDQPPSWRQSIDWGVLDRSGAYRRAFDVALPHAGQVADPFHVIRLANHSIDEVRRRSQNDTLGHRGRKDDPLYRARRLLISAHERLSERGDAKVRGLLTAGDPHGEVRLAWHAKETPPRPLRHRLPPTRQALRHRTRRAPARRRLPARTAPPRPHPGPLAHPNRQLAPRPHHQRTHRSGQQPHKTSQTRRVRIPPLRALPHPRTPLRRQTQLEPPRRSHFPLKSEAPAKPPDRSKRVPGQQITCTAPRPTVFLVRPVAEQEHPQVWVPTFLPQV